MQIKQQSPNFGAIQIKGAKKNSPQLKIAKRIVQKEILSLEKGETKSGKNRRYINTQKGSEQERMLIARLKKVLSSFYNVEISKFSNKKAAQNIERKNTKTLERQK